MVAPTQIVDAISTGEDRYVPRYQVLFAKEPISELEPNPPAVKGPVDLATAIEQEFSRLEAKVYRASGDPNNPAPKLGDLLPLAGPWGEKQGQYTNDVVSVEFTESIDKKQPLSKVKVELHNVFDFEARQFRYTDVLKESPDGRPGVFPLIEYGDTLALRFGYGSDILWVFEGIITTLEADFPADGQPKLTITAVDKRERLRNRKKVKRSQFSGMSEEEVAAAVASEVGLTVATVASVVAVSVVTAAGFERPLGRLIDAEYPALVSGRIRYIPQVCDSGQLPKCRRGKHRVEFIFARKVFPPVFCVPRIEPWKYFHRDKIRAGPVVKRPHRNARRPHLFQPMQEPHTGERADAHRAGPDSVEHAGRKGGAASFGFAQTPVFEQRSPVAVHIEVWRDRRWSARRCATI